MFYIESEKDNDIIYHPLLSTLEDDKEFFG